MNAVIITIVVLLGVFVALAFAKMARINNRIDDIFNKALTMQGEIEANTARAKDNYKLIAKFNTEVEKVESTIAELHKHEPTDEPAKEVEAELENLVPEQEEEEEEEEELSNKELELLERRECFAHLRAHGVSLHDAADKMHISYSTAKRYEKWRVDNKK